MQTKEAQSIKEVDLSGLKSPVIVLFAHPDDDPEMYVARIFDLNKPTDTVIRRSSLADLTRDIQKNTHMVFFPRSREDVPALIGAWM